MHSVEEVVHKPLIQAHLWGDRKGGGLGMSTVSQANQPGVSSGDDSVSNKVESKDT